MASSRPHHPRGCLKLWRHVYATSWSCVWLLCCSCRACSFTASVVCLSRVQCRLLGPENVFIVSKAGRKIANKSILWLEHHDVFNTSGTTWFVLQSPLSLSLSLSLPLSLSLSCACLRCRIIHDTGLLPDNIHFCRTREEKRPIFERWVALACLKCVECHVCGPSCPRNGSHVPRNHVTALCHTRLGLTHFVDDTREVGVAWCWLSVVLPSSWCPMYLLCRSSACWMTHQRASVCTCFRHKSRRLAVLVLIRALAVCAMLWWCHHGTTWCVICGLRSHQKCRWRLLVNMDSVLMIANDKAIPHKCL